MSLSRDKFQRVFKLLGTNELLPNGVINELSGQRYCVEEAFTQVLCTNLLFLICGPNSDQLNNVSVTSCLYFSIFLIFGALPVSSTPHYWGYEYSYNYLYEYSYNSYLIDDKIFTYILSNLCVIQVT